VFVAMSGGVDSSVAAALLVEAGHDVTGVTMQLLPEGDDPGQCCGTDAVRAARRVCDLLGIPHYALNSRDVFEREVIAPFVEEYAAGRTPNPCIACNDRVKFADLLARVRAQGADALATGHYARIERDSGDTAWLARGLDADKDQSYFLYRLVPPAIEDVIFPVGEMRKTQVRDVARRLDLPTADRPESQEICFVADGGVASFIGSFAPGSLQPGPIVDSLGKHLGTHSGVARYTVGQRKGLGIASPEPLYVLAIDAAGATITVGTHAKLARDFVFIGDAIWRPDADEARVEVQTRYRMQPVPATARRSSQGIEIEFDSPVTAVAPGQAVVCYEGDRVVAGGVV
jgi:tRNA-specific 2-thiouridylase